MLFQEEERSPDCIRRGCQSVLRLPGSNARAGTGDTNTASAGDTNRAAAGDTNGAACALCELLAVQLGIGGGPYWPPAIHVVIP